MSIVEARRLLLLTATITPAVDTPRLVRSDPQTRLSDYADSLRHYSQSLSPDSWQLALVENSGYDLQVFESIAKQHGHRLVALGFRSEMDIRSKGKGAAEAEILDYALLRLIDVVPASSQVTKVTGRLLVRNVARLVPPMSSPHLACRVRNDHSMVDTRVMDFDMDTWRRFLSGLGALVDESRGRYLEHAVALRLAQALFDGPPRWVELKEELDIVGTSGTDGIRYDTVRSQIARWLKNGLRLVPRSEYR